MSWTTAVEDLRALLNDGPEDKYCYRKKVFGRTDGSNTAFKTFEYRRVTDFTGSDLPLGVFVNNELQTVTDDFVNTGEFTLRDAPSDGDLIEASYYVQWFLDSELEKFITEASKWLGFDVSYSNIPAGLQPAAIKYAEGQAFAKLALKFTVLVADMYRADDKPDKERVDQVKSFKDAADAAYKLATERRNEYYTRQGQPLQPLFGYAGGHVSDPQPKR